MMFFVQVSGVTVVSSPSLGLGHRSDRLSLGLQLLLLSIWYRTIWSCVPTILMDVPRCLVTLCIQDAKLVLTHFHFFR